MLDLPALTSARYSGSDVKDTRSTPEFYGLPHIYTSPVRYSLFLESNGKFHRESLAASTATKRTDLYNVMTGSKSSQKHRIYTC